MDLGQQTLSVEVWTPSEAGVGRGSGDECGACGIRAPRERVVRT